MSEKKGQKGEDFKFNFDSKGQVLDLAGKDAALLQHFQKKLGGLVGKSSGYLESLPQSVQQRVKALKHLHGKRRELEEQYEQELILLEKKFNALFQPLIDRRQTIVAGEAEPTAEELIVKEEPKAEEKKDEKKDDKKDTKAEAKDENVKGIPEFWLQTLKHHDDFAEFITERDEEAMKHLTNITVAPVADSPHSFTIEFHFSSNEFFENDILKKTYVLNKNPEDGEIMYDHVDCSEIKWKAGKNLTVRKVTKQQKKKKGGKKGGKGQGGATITVEEPCQSFFNFFTPEAAYAMYSGLEPEEEEEDEENYGLQEFLEADYEMGIDLKDKIIPHAVMFFTGEYASNSLFFEDGEDDEDQDDEEDDEEYDEEKDEDFKPQEGAQAAQPECKQQ